MAVCDNRIHVGDVGTVFRITLADCGDPVDVSQATASTITFKKPDETLVTQTASFTTDGTDGQVQYVTITGDLDLPGTWRIQAAITLPDGFWRSNISKFKVYANLS